MKIAYDAGFPMLCTPAFV